MIWTNLTTCNTRQTAMSAAADWNDTFLIAVIHKLDNCGGDMMREQHVWSIWTLLNQRRSQQWLRSGHSRCTCAIHNPCTSGRSLRCKRPGTEAGGWKHHASSYTCSSLPCPPPGGAFRAGCWRLLKREGRCQNKGSERGLSAQRSSAPERSARVWEGNRHRSQAPAWTADLRSYV